MARSLSLAAYLAYARRAPVKGQDTHETRPAGSVIWAHIAETSHADALIQLLERIKVQRPDTSLILTSTADQPSLNAERKDGVYHELISDDTVANADSFLNSWQPDFLLWAGGDLKPAFIERAASQSIPMALIDADSELLMKSSWRWFPDLPRALIEHFQFTYARNEETARLLRRIGVNSQKVMVSGRFLDGAVTLPCNEMDREEMAQILVGRPVWLAARLLPDEMQTVLDAHKEVAKRSHRAMLIVVPEDPEDRESFVAELDRRKMRYLLWSEGQIPDEATQVVLADTKGEMGLWYRIAPISFMGSSLFKPGQGCDPNEPAAHGSAILFGPEVHRYAPTYARFSKVGAARIVRDASALAGSVIRLLQPDQSAMMAHAAWEVSSRNTELTETIAERILDFLDRGEAG